jgi:prepilin-type N-terminal cleavage/methylation domain-containing protein
VKRRTSSRRAGFTLIEIMVAVVILGIASAGIARVMVRGAGLARVSAQLSYRAAAMNGEIARITAIPAGALADGTTVYSTSTGPFPHTVTTVAQTSGSIQTVTITVAPTGVSAIGSASRTLQRAATVTLNPFGS